MPKACRCLRATFRPRMLSADRADMSERFEANESPEAAEPAEPIESTEQTEPTEPIEPTDPIEPIERIEASLPIERTDSRDLTDQSDAMPSTVPNPLPSRGRVSEGCES